MYFFKAGHRVRQAQKCVFLQVRDMSSPAVDPEAAAVAVAAAGWVTAWAGGPVVALPLVSNQYPLSRRGMMLEGLRTPDLVDPL